MNWQNLLQLTCEDWRLALSFWSSNFVPSSGTSTSGRTNRISDGKINTVGQRNMGPKLTWAADFKQRGWPEYMILWSISSSERRELPMAFPWGWLMKGYQLASGSLALMGEGGRNCRRWSQEWWCIHGFQLLLHTFPSRFHPLLLATKLVLLSLLMKRRLLETAVLPSRYIICDVIKLITDKVIDGMKEL